MEQNPKTQRQWRYTWEAQSHSPNLRLFLFDSQTNPKIHCKSLHLSVIPGKSQLLVTWIEENGREETVTLLVPVPRVLIDAESPVDFRALEDHIEVRLVLLLPVDHPLVSDLSLVTDSSLEDTEKSKPLVMDYDLKTLSSSKEGVNFYCRNCSARLTKKPLFDFSEMPSSNWRESADNWFGTCCCSFGGISEKMVANYTHSYSCSSGSCFLSATTVLLSKDDLVLSDRNGNETTLPKDGSEGDDSPLIVVEARVPECYLHDSANERFRLDETLSLDKKFLLDGFLEDVFMAKASNVSKDVKWIEFVCCGCSSPLGAYPYSGKNNYVPIDGGVRLFKCCISTSCESSDAFNKYSLERMFTNQLVEFAKEELSFHVLVKDLTTKSPLFQIGILNPNSWSSTGLCLSRDEPNSTTVLSPIVKVLFSDCKSSTGKKIDEEVYVLKGQGDELVELLKNGSKFLPPSFSFLQGSLVSSMHL